MNLTKEEMAKLESASSKREWTDTCDEIKQVRGGQYPPDWWAKVKLSGMMARIVARWDDDDRLHIYPLR